jgi:hypothetical protein
VVCRRSRTSKERIAGRTGQVEGRGQRAHGLDMGPSALSALERTHSVHRETRNRRELFLRKARGFAERFELGAK